MQMRVKFVELSRDCVKLRTPCLSMGGPGRGTTLVEEVGERR